MTRPNPLKLGKKLRCLDFCSHFWVARIKTGIKTNTVIRLMATPFASARPKSGPIWNCMNTRAKKPITVVSPLERMELVDLHRASTMASLGVAVSVRHSSNR